MPRPVFPVVRLPYDQPDRVARVLDTVRREFKACRQLQTAAASTSTNRHHHGRACEQLQHRLGFTMMTREPEMIPAGVAAEPTGITTTTVYADQTVVDQVTVGVRDCTLTPKARPEILVTAGGAPAMYLINNNKQNLAPSVAADDGPYLLVPPVNITAEISRPPLTPQYTATL